MQLSWAHQFCCLFLVTLFANTVSLPNPLSKHVFLLCHPVRPFPRSVASLIYGYSSYYRHVFGCICSLRARLADKEVRYAGHTRTTGAPHQKVGALALGPGTRI